MKTKALIPALLIGCGLAVTGYDALEGNVALRTVGATVVGGRAPAQEIEQIYYLGVFDP